MRLTATVVALVCAAFLLYVASLGIGRGIDSYHARIDASFACLSDPDAPECQ